MMHVSETPQGREDVVFRQLADDWVLFDPAANQIHVLNLSAALVWTSCTGRLTVDDICREVTGSYPDAPDQSQIERDVRGALDRFRSEGLLQ